MYFEDERLLDAARDAVEDENIDVGLEHVKIGAGVDLDFEIADREFVGDELAFAGVGNELLPDRGAGVHGAEGVPHREVVKTGDGPEDFALGSLAAAGCPEENKGLVLVRTFADHGFC